MAGEEELKSSSVKAEPDGFASAAAATPATPVEAAPAAETAPEITENNSSNTAVKIAHPFQPIFMRHTAFSAR